MTLLDLYKPLLKFFGKNLKENPHAQLLEHEEEKTFIKSENIHLSKKVNDIDSLNADFKNKILELEQMNHVQKSESREKIDELLGQIKALESGKEILLRECHDHQFAKQEVEIRATNLETLNQKLVHDLESVNQIISSLTNRIEEVIADKEVLSAKLNESDLTAEKLMEQLNRFQNSDLCHDELADESELLHLQLLQTQDELEQCFNKINYFDNAYQILKARWSRMERRYPGYVDFSEIQLIEVDSSSEIPCIILQVKDYARDGIELPILAIKFGLQDGQPGICLIDNTQEDKGANKLLVAPGLFKTSSKHATHFLKLKSSEFGHLTAAIGILAQLDNTKWQAIKALESFDNTFWSSAIRQLVEQWKILPKVLRYGNIKLKRELINSDYEHLWLEFNELQYGNEVWKKIEIRIGASLIQPKGFSEHPKFEIPLIDSKFKPFKSWFAESHDDAGSKFELRFSLEKNIFDVPVLYKLSVEDRLFVVRLISLVPDALKDIEFQRISIHRPWADWIDFASKARKVLLDFSNKNSKNSQPELVINTPKMMASKEIDAKSIYKIISIPAVKVQDKSKATRNQSVVQKSSKKTKEAIKPKSLSKSKK